MTTPPSPSRASDPEPLSEAELFAATTPAPIRTAADAPAEGMVPNYVRSLGWILDDAIPLVGKRRIGVDGFLSFIPGIGDATGFGLSAIIVLAGIKAGCNWITIIRITINALCESIIGLIPFVGPLFGFAWKANNRNLRIIERDLINREATKRESWKVVIAGLVALAIMVLLTIGGIVFFVWTIVRRFG